MSLMVLLKSCTSRQNRVVVDYCDRKDMNLVVNSQGIDVCVCG
jgi:hypothetical protein